MYNVDRPSRHEKHKKETTKNTQYRTTLCGKRTTLLPPTLAEVPPHARHADQTL